ncbi:MAG: hypothetical protein QOD63_987 [Actinomycetota bacterium]|jgi:hypothetical protein|nr:hypothetical protein [Actinomycetota bacterium]
MALGSRVLSSPTPHGRTPSAEDKTCIPPLLASEVLAVIGSADGPSSARLGRLRQAPSLAFMLFLAAKVRRQGPQSPTCWLAMYQ